MERRILDANLPVIKALALLDNPEYSGQLDAVGFYDLMLAATENEEQAQKAGSKRAADRQEIGLKP